MVDYLGLTRWAISIIVPALSGFLGVLIGAWLTARREKWQRRYTFLERQLRDFYSPLLGIRTEIRKKSELRAAISQAADTEWRRLCAEARDTSIPEENLSKLETTRWPEFEGIINYNSRQLREEIMPEYRRMLSIFRENLWLADIETRPYFGKLSEFVDLWERWLARAIPYEVIHALGHSEESLQPFYEHLEKKHDELRGRLSKGEA